MRRTRMLCTVGPASESDARLAALLAAGCDAFRLNFSHGRPEHHADVCRRIRAAAASAGRPVAVVQDLAGPKIRIGDLPAPLQVAAGDVLAIERGDGPGGPGRVTIAFAPLFEVLTPGARVLIDDGRVVLEVMETGHARVRARVVTGGTLSSRKGVHVPGAVLRRGALSARDAADLAAGVAMDVDAVAVSFVESAEDLRQVRRAAAAAGRPVLPLIAKIERPQALDHLDEILDEADGLMVARGDLGIELPLETLPAIQRHLVQEARRRGVPAIIATEVLESMRSSSRPTRAEVTDAAHAVEQGADAIMLAGETAVGEYPVEAVATLDRIIREAERARSFAPVPADIPRGSAHARGLCEAAVALAARVSAAAIVAVTGTGTTARILAALRPQAPIVAATADERLARQLSLVWGVRPLVVPPDDLAGVRRAVADGHVPAGSAVVFVSVSQTMGPERSNFVRVERL